MKIDFIVIIVRWGWQINIRDGVVKDVLFLGVFATY